VGLGRQFIWSSRKQYIYKQCNNANKVGTTDWNSMSAGFEHVATIKNNGTLWVWGSGGNGQMK
jgi:alpha-tubulin suppressor-like RCC1 family protein